MEGGSPDPSAILALEAKMVVPKGFKNVEIHEVLGCFRWLIPAGISWGLCLSKRGGGVPGPPDP